MNENPIKEVIAFTDGSSLGNGQRTETRAACAAILSHGPMTKAFAEYIGPATNQQTEIHAALLAVQSLKEPCRLQVVTDSRYVVATMTPGPGQFRRKANFDLWDKLEEAIRRGGHVVTFQWTRGHNGNARQEAADELARSVATAGRVEPFMLRRAVARFDQERLPMPPIPPPFAKALSTPGLLLANVAANANP